MNNNFNLTVSREVNSDCYCTISTPNENDSYCDYCFAINTPVNKNDSYDKTTFSDGEHNLSEDIYSYSDVYISNNENYFELYHGKSNLEEPSIVSLTTTESNDTLNQIKRIGDDNLSLITVGVSKQNDVVFASDSRSTKKTEDGTILYNDNEQKIFQVKDSSIVLCLTGTNRFAVDCITIEKFINSYMGPFEIDKVMLQLKNWLSCYAYQSTSTTIFLVDVKHPHDICIVLFRNGQISHQWHRIYTTELFVSGCDLGVQIAKNYAYLSDTTENLVLSIKNLFIQTYNFLQSVKKDFQVIAPPTQIFIGHPDGKIERVE